MLTAPGSSGRSSAASVQAQSPFAADTVRAEIRQAAIEQELIGRASLDCSPAGCTGEVEFYQRLAELGAPTHGFDGEQPSRGKPALDVGENARAKVKSPGRADRQEKTSITDDAPATPIRRTDSRTGSVVKGWSQAGTPVPQAAQTSVEEQNAPRESFSRKSTAGRAPGTANAARRPDDVRGAGGSVTKQSMRKALDRPALRPTVKVKADADRMLRGKQSRLEGALRRLQIDEHRSKRNLPRESEARMPSTCFVGSLPRSGTAWLDKGRPSAKGAFDPRDVFDMSNKDSMTGTKNNPFDLLRLRRPTTVFQGIATPRNPRSELKLPLSILMHSCGSQLKGSSHLSARGTTSDPIVPALFGNSGSCIPHHRAAAMANVKESGIELGDGLRIVYAGEKQMSGGDSDDGGASILSTLNRGERGTSGPEETCLPLAAHSSHISGSHQNILYLSTSPLQVVHDVSRESLESFPSEKEAREESTPHLRPINQLNSRPQTANSELTQDDVWRWEDLEESWLVNGSNDISRVTRDVAYAENRKEVVSKNVFVPIQCSSSRLHDWQRMEAGTLIKKNEIVVRPCTSVQSAIEAVKAREKESLYGDYQETIRLAQQEQSPTSWQGTRPSPNGRPVLFQDSNIRKSAGTIDCAGQDHPRCTSFKGQHPVAGAGACRVRIERANFFRRILEDLNRQLADAVVLTVADAFEIESRDKLQPNQFEQIFGLLLRYVARQGRPDSKSLRTRKERVNSAAPVVLAGWGLSGDKTASPISCEVSYDEFVDKVWGNAVQAELHQWHWVDVKPGHSENNAIVPCSDVVVQRPAMISRPKPRRIQSKFTSSTWACSNGQTKLGFRKDTVQLEREHTAGIHQTSSTLDELKNLRLSVGHVTGRTETGHAHRAAKPESQEDEMPRQNRDRGKLGDLFVQAEIWKVALVYVPIKRSITLRFSLRLNGKTQSMKPRVDETTRGRDVVARHNNVPVLEQKDFLAAEGSVPDLNPTITLNNKRKERDARENMKSTGMMIDHPARTVAFGTSERHSRNTGAAMIDTNTPLMRAWSRVASRDSPNTFVLSLDRPVDDIEHLLPTDRENL